MIILLLHVSFLRIVSSLDMGLPFLADKAKVLANQANIWADLNIEENAHLRDFPPHPPRYRRSYRRRTLPLAALHRHGVARTLKTVHLPCFYP